MARAKYIVTAADLTHARSYLESRLRNFGVQFAEDVSPKKAERALAEASQEPRKEKRAELINDWCEQYLSSAEWEKLKLAIRKRRERRTRTDLKSVTVSARAFGLLSKLAERDNVTYSQVLENYLLKALNAKRR